MSTIRLRVADMHCGNCAAAITKGLAADDRVVKVQADPATKEVAVTLKDDVPADTAQSLIAILDELGFGAVMLGDEC